MSAKRSEKPTVISETVVFTEEDKKLPEYKALVKKKEELKKNAEMAARLPKVLKFASTTFGKEFVTLKGFSSFVAKMEGKKGGTGKRAKRLTDEQRAKISQLNKEGKTAKEIIKEVGCSKAQVNGVLYAKK